MTNGPRKPRILLLLHELSNTGAPHVALQTFGWIGDRAEVRLVSLDGGPCQSEAEKLGPLQILLEPSRSRILHRAFATLPRGAALRLAGKAITLSGSLARWKPDIIYVNSLVALNAARYFRLPKVPVLLHVHELGSAIEQFVGRFPHLLQELPAAYLADSQAVRRDLDRRWHIPTARVEVVHPAINPNAFQGRAPRSEPTLPTSENPFVVGGAGRLVWCKGWELWLQTAALLDEKLAGRARFLWLGGGTSETILQFEETARRLGLKGKVERRERVADPLAVFEAMDAFALCSWEDACPLVALENMALGNVVACFAGGGGARETVGESGLVIERFSPEAMADSLAQLALDPSRRQEMGKMARTRALSEFSLDNQAPKIWAKILQVAS